MVLSYESAPCEWRYLNGLRGAEAVYSAERIAGEDPYCVRVPGDGGYREVRSWWDLSILSMRTTDWKQASHHAVLAIERADGIDLAHWSRWNQRFEGGVLGPPAVYCSPEQHSLRNLGFRGKPEQPNYVIRADGMTLSIPKKYGAYSAINSHGLMFFASSPGFESLATRPITDVPAPMEQVMVMIEVYFGRASLLTTWLTQTGPDHPAEEGSMERGLSKHMVWELHGQQSPLYRSSVEYFLRGSDGEVDTIIHCDSIDAGDCMHAFYQDGWTYVFHHPKRDLRDWREMQRVLSTLARSFIVSGTPAVINEGIYSTHLIFKVARWG